MLGRTHIPLLLKRLQRFQAWKRNGIEENVSPPQSPLKHVFPQKKQGRRFIVKRYSSTQVADVRKIRADPASSQVLQQGHLDPSTIR
jgi:hypothetical protein